jgi:hypothetical protein
MKNLMRIPATKSVMLLCIIVASTIGAVFAGIGLTNMRLTNTTVVKPGAGVDSNVTIYGNGFTFINCELNTTLTGGTNVFQFYLPSGALTDTLTLTGISVAKITTTEESNPMIEKGDVITVYTEDATYTGKFIGWDNMLLLEANNGTVMIPGDRITRIILSEVVQVQGPRILVQVTTDSSPGEYKMRISYLMRGPKWKPTYFIDLETSYLTCWATIENVETWDNFTLTLVSGGPHVVYAGPIFFPYLAAQAFISAPAVVDFTPTSSDEYHEYTYNAKLSFENGTVVKLPLFNGTVNLRQEYFWASGDVQNRYDINNSLTEPLAAGIIEFYRGQAWVGEDSIGYTPENAETTAIVNYAYDIKVNATVTKSINDNNYQDQGTEITIQNHKTTNIQILVNQDINGYALVTSTPSATRVGSVLSWIINIDAGSSATIYYEWGHHW